MQSLLKELEQAVLIVVFLNWVAELGTMVVWQLMLLLQDKVSMRSHPLQIYRETIIDLTLQDLNQACPKPVWLRLILR